MKKNKISALYDVLIYAIICTPLFISAVIIFVTGIGLNNFDWLVKNWYLVLTFAIGLVSPFIFKIFIKHVTITDDYAFFYHFPLTFSWEKASNNIDIKWNQKVFVSEIKNVKIVKLSKEEKETKVFYKHWCNKYLKINLKYGNSKYVYVGNYSKFQIQRIIKLLTNKIEC